MTGVSGAKENLRLQTIIVIVGSLLMVSKFVAYMMTNSVAIFTDAMESIVNILAGTVGLYALYISPKPPDEDHPYGHGRAEVISAAFEGALIMVAGLIIIWFSIQGLRSPPEISDLDFGMVIIFFAAIVNLIMGRTAIKVGKKNRSQALEASGRHLCTDTLDSFGIIIGLFAVYIGMYLGYDVAWMDPAIALLFGIIILSTAYKVLKGTVDTIMDRADPVIVSKITDNIIRNRHDNWIDIHGLRIKKYGINYSVDLHATFPRYMTVDEVETEIKQLHKYLKEEFGKGTELIVKAEPCRDFSCPLCTLECPIRKSDFVQCLEWCEENMVEPAQHKLNGE